MARKSNQQLAAESALSNLNCLAEMAKDNRENFRQIYYRNQSDADRWLSALRRNGNPCPDYVRGSLQINW